MDTIHEVKETTLAVEKKPLVLVLPSLGSMFKQIGTKSKKSLKNIPLAISKTTLGKAYHFKDCFHKDLVSSFTVNCEMSAFTVNVCKT